MRGVRVRADASWLVVVALVAWSFWARFAVRGETADGTVLAMVVGATALFFASILTHELAHALEARRRGVDVKGITLFLFGGATETEREPDRPVDELVVTAIGPFASLVVAAALGLVAVLADGTGWQEVAEVAGVVAWLNLALAVFNLLPGAPLDGGRILGALVWRHTGDRRRSQVVAARAGQVVGGSLLALGLFELLFLPSTVIGGLWLAFIGWFLMRAAGAELAEAQLQDLVRDLPARPLVGPPVRAIPADATLEDAVEHWLRTEPDDDVFPVEDDGWTVGLLHVDDVQPARRRRRGLRVREVMRPVDGVRSLDVDRATGSEVLDVVRREGLVVATDHGHVVAVVTVPRVASAVRRLEQLDERFPAAS